jgi:hypothetical protein
VLEQEEKMRLSERTVLTSLHIGSWTGNAIDRQVTEEVSETHSADITGAGRYSKQLIAKRFLQQVNSKISVTRRVHRLLTLPWDDDARILSIQGYQHYTEQMRLNRLATEAAAAEFVSHYDSHIHEARTRLGSMFNREDYPAADVILKKFYIDVEIKPVPEAGDFRAELTNQSVEAITKDIERRTDQRLEAAVNDVFKRISDCAARMVERLRAYKPVEGGRAENSFKDSLVWNIKELADLLPSLNITGDKRLDDLQAKLLDDLTSNSPEILRDNERLREQTANKAEAIMKKVEKYLA